MRKAVYVTEIKERKWEWLRRDVRLPIFEQKPENFDEQLKWSKKYEWRFNYKVHKDNLEKAKILAKQLWDLGPNPDPKIERGIIEELKKIEAKKYEDMSDVERWGDMAIQMPGDWGPIGEKKKELREIITEKAHGRVLEAMCGFNSYFGESERITEVIALDFCRETLERYQYPERTRILYNLENVVKGEKIDFFEDSSFETIGVFFGIEYLTNPLQVCREFYRILANNGELLIVGGTTQGYKDILKRMFKPEECSNTMKSAGFSTEILHLPLKTDGEFGEYYLVKGKK